MIERIISTRVLRYTATAVLAFMAGSASIVLAAGSGAMQLPTFRLADGVNTEQYAKVDAAGNVQVSVNNMPATQQVSGTVNVGNFPSTQQVSGSVSVSNLPASLSSGRTILLASNVTAISHNGVATSSVDTSDCRSLVAMSRHAGTVSDVTLKLVITNPDGSGFGPVSGSVAGIGTYFTVGGTNIVTPKAGIDYQSTTGGDVLLEAVWLFCGH